MCFNAITSKGARTPLILPCGHTICKECVQSLINQDKKICPTCCEEFQASHHKFPPPNHTLISSLKLGGEEVLRNEKYCQADKLKHPEQFVLAQNFCRDCGLILCNDCAFYNPHSQEHDDHFNRKKIISVEIYEKEREQLKQSYCQTLSDIKTNL